MIQHHCSVDIETYSDVDIKKAGLYKYAQSPAFDILLIAYAVDDGPVQIIDLTLDAGADGSGSNYQAWVDFLARLHDPYTLLHAYNAAFEHYCINTFLRRRGLAEIPLSRWRCTMAHGLYLGYPAGLAAIGEAMGLPQDKRKMAMGGALIRKFCVPQKSTRARPCTHRVMPAEEPEKWELFKSYCRQDVETEREIGRRLARWPMPEREQLLWEITTEANMEGVGVDMDLVAGALAMGAEEQAALEAEAKELSGLDNPKSVQQLLKWLNTEMETDEETAVKDLRKATVADMLAAGVPSDKAARMLELRQLMSKTSTKKFDALEAAVCADGRVRGMMFYYGAARTGRWAGRIVQPQNLPQNHLDSLAFARERVKAVDAEMVKVCWGSVPDTLSQLIRTAFVPRPGKLYAVADYSAIEARVVAWLAGEEWVLDAFRAGKDIYCETASQMFGVPVGKHGPNADLRQKGKIAVLALGYGGGESALTAMGAIRMGIAEEDLPEIKAKWRQANPAICRLWGTMEAKAQAAVETGKLQRLRLKYCDPERARENEAKTGAEEGSFSDWFLAGADLAIFRREADPDTTQDFLTIQLPTGRKLFYAHPFLAPAKNIPDRMSLHYYGTAQATKKWGTVDTWGGKLTENCVAKGTLVVTNQGLVPIEKIRPDHLIWDGVEFVPHEGLIDKGVQKTNWVDGLRLTPEHKILTTKGWVESAKSGGLDWKAAPLPGCCVPTGSRMADRITVCGTGRKEPIYDIRNCGPRHRFAVYDPTTWCCRIVSNCTQAIARDCLAETLIRLRDIGLTAVFHVHDEVIVEVDRPEQLDDVLEIMARPLSWAPGLPLKGAGFVCDYYQKD